jgi:hypothetical protein
MTDEKQKDAAEFSQRLFFGGGTRAEWLGTESNRRHADFQSAALPTELPSRSTYRLDRTINPIAIF